MTDVPAVRKRLVALSTSMYERSVPYIESLLPESGVAIPSHGRAVRDAAEGLIAGNVFLFTLAAVLRVAQESDHPLGPILAERMARMASEAMNAGLDWLGGANDDLDGEPDPVEQIPGQQEIPAEAVAPLESLLESVRRERLIGPHAVPGESIPTHPGPGETCQDPACVKSRRQHEAAAELQRITFQILDGAYETDADPEPKIGDHGTCSAQVGRGAEGTGTCGYEIVLREERTVLMADGTDGHGKPGGQLVLAWRHEDPAIDRHHRAQLGGPA